MYFESVTGSQSGNYSCTVTIGDNVAMGYGILTVTCKFVMQTCDKCSVIPFVASCTINSISKKMYLFIVKMFGISFSAEDK